MSTLSELGIIESHASEAQTLDDYESERPRWCSGCGDHGVLAGLHRVQRKRDLEPTIALTHHARLP